MPWMSWVWVTRSNALADNSLIAAALLNPHAGVNPAVYQIDQDDHEYQEAAVEHGGTHDDRVVQLLHGLDEVAPQPRYRKDDFHHKTAGGDDGDLGAQHRNDRQYGVTQLVASENLRGRHALGLSGTHEI